MRRWRRTGAMLKPTGVASARDFIHASTASNKKPRFRSVMRTGGGKVPAWTIRHSVVRDTPIISTTSRGLMNCTGHLRFLANSDVHVLVQAKGQRAVTSRSPQVLADQRAVLREASYG